MTDSKTLIDITHECYHPDFYKAILDSTQGGSDAYNDYVMKHLIRYLCTLKHMPVREQFGDAPVFVLELGTSLVFPFILRKLFRFEVVEVSCFESNLDKEFEICPPRMPEKIRGFNIDLESEPIPRPDGYYDMVLCFEVIEHLERDPLYMIAEINRVLKPSGLLYLTTPNICSSRNVQKILEGWAPHFHMKYRRDRGLYRHNIEYAPHQIHAMMTAGGFRARKILTVDTFEPPSSKAIELLSQHGYPVDMRGDNFFGIYEKVTGVLERWPDEIYE